MTSSKDTFALRCTVGGEPGSAAGHDPLAFGILQGDIVEGGQDLPPQRHGTLPCSGVQAAVDPVVVIRMVLVEPVDTGGQVAEATDLATQQGNGDRVQATSGGLKE
jgi:hypothetical protein